VKLLRLPITVRVPLIVTLFMVTVSMFASERVLSRLIETQTRHLQDLADNYLDGLALALVDSMLREDIWQVFDMLDRSRRRPGDIKPVETIVAGADGFVIASSDPHRVPSQTRVPPRYLKALGPNSRMAIANGMSQAYVRREVAYENRPVGSIYAGLDIAPLLAERREVLWTLILTNAGLTLLLSGAAWLIVRRMMRPVHVLTSYLERSHTGEVSPIPDSVLARTSSDYKDAFEAYNRLAAALAEREALGAQLAEEERLASLGRLASGMAHEINNPLGGLFNAIDTLKQHGDKPAVRRSTIELVERGLKGICDVVRAALMSYRTERDQRFLRPEDIGDLRLLISPEARRRGVFLEWRNGLVAELPVAASSVRQIVLNLVLNACHISPRDCWISVTLSEVDHALVLSVEDQGPGMQPEAVAMLQGTGGLRAPIDQRIGLGLWMTNRLVRELAGKISIDTGAGTGTRVTVSVPLRRQMELSHVA
jgi:signal transduction histidine kinase